MQLVTFSVVKCISGRRVRTKWVRQVYTVIYLKYTVIYSYIPEIQLKNLDSFWIEYITQEALNKIRDKSITHNIFKVQDNKSILCGFHYIAFMKCMLSGKSFLGYTNLFYLNDYKRNDKIIYEYFKDKHGGNRKSPFRKNKT